MENQFTIRETKGKIDLVETVWQGNANSDPADQRNILFGTSSYLWQLVSEEQRRLALEHGIEYASRKV